MLLIVMMTFGALLFSGLLLLTLFSQLNPRTLEADYVKCAGGWHEAHLKGCEQGLQRMPQQPVNTYTNLTYLAAGIYTYFTLQTLPSFVFAATMAYLCVGSALYHGTATRWASMIDITAMYAVFSGLAAYALGVLLGATPAVIALVIFIVAGLAVFLLSRRFQHNMQVKVGIFLGVTLVLILARMWASGIWESWRILLVSLGLFAIAFWIWHLDLARKFPLKGWGHGFWHILTGIASGILFYVIHLSE